MTKMDSLLIKQEKYLESGIHIGTKIKTNDMSKYIFRMRHDQLYILDLRKIDEKIRMAAKLLAKYEPEDILVVASRIYSGNAASVFSKIVGTNLVRGRYVPGTMTNLSMDRFVEPKILFVSDPRGERQAIKEATKNGIPIIALCDTEDSTSNIDLVIPCNNKGRKSLALIYYLLTREILVMKGKIENNEKFEHNLREFERGEIKEKIEEVVEEKAETQ